MDAEYLYELIKRALNHFDLKWEDKAKMKVMLRKDEVEFEYGKRGVAYRVKKEKGP